MFIYLAQFTLAQTTGYYFVVTCQGNWAIFILQNLFCTRITFVFHPYVTLGGKLPNFLNK